MKWILILLNLLPIAAMTQDKVLVVEGSSPNLYISHTVQPKENYYSIGRLYNVNPREIAPFNKFEMAKGLNPGQVLKIPLNETNFIQKNIAATDETLLPLYYMVKEKEGLYRIGINHNKLSVETLKKLNDLKGEEVNVGAELVVGYLKVKKSQSQLLSKTPGNIKEKKVPVENAVIKPVKNEVPIVIEVEKKDTVQTTPRVPGQDFGGGFFKELYEQQILGKTVLDGSGTAGVFKSKSGRNDGKYYCLFNNSTPGTIIKVTNTVSGRSVFAKVLDGMPDIKQNSGLLIQVSNAAADELGAGENNFKCTINFLK